MTEFVSKLLRRWDSTANDLLPAYFAMVMATGIVAIAAHIYGMNYFSQFLFYVDLIGYAVLWALSLYRMAVHGKRYLADLTDHARGPGFFTVIAGNNTLGSVFLLVERNYTIAFGLWIFGFILWVFYQYFIFSALSLDKNKPTLEKGINGAWLVAIVSTQSVSVLAAQLSPLHHWMYLVALVMYMIGWMTYILVMSLINYRLLFMKLDSSDITGPYWINMGGNGHNYTCRVTPAHRRTEFKLCGIFHHKTLSYWSHCDDMGIRQLVDTVAIHCWSLEIYPGT